MLKIGGLFEKEPPLLFSTLCPMLMRGREEVNKPFDMKRIGRCLAFAASLACSWSIQAEQNWEAIVCSYGSQDVCPVSMPQGQVPVQQTPGEVSGEGRPFEIAISPDRSRAVITNDFVVFLFDLTTNPIQQITLADYSSDEATGYGVAITPDGSKAFVCLENELVVLRLSDFQELAKIRSSDFGGESIYYIAISPTKPEAYVVCGSDVRVINTETYAVDPTPIAVPNPNRIAVTPDGSAAYVTQESRVKTATSKAPSIAYPYCVTRVDLSDRTFAEVPGIFRSAEGVAIAPDGKTAYAVNLTPDATFELATIDTQSLAVHSLPITQIETPVSLAISPDGKTAVMVNEGRLQIVNEVKALLQPSGPLVDFMTLSTGSETVVDLSVKASDASGLQGISITPDQAPTARFSATPNGATVTFDASASTSPTGTIVLYSWDFGDGQTASTDSPSITHTYANSGDYSITLTVTNSAGTSLTVTFTGQTVSNNGGPSAQTTQQIAVAAIDPPSHFKAKVKYRHHKEMLFLKSKWKKSHSPHIKKYQIFAYNKKIKTIKAHHELCSWIHLHPHHVPHHFSKKYREYAHHKYAIRAVDSTGHASSFIPIVVKH